MDAKPKVITDKFDYAPGSTAHITASGFTPGATVAFHVGHVLDGGADGVLGTPDDTPGDNSGGGHEAWRVTDGGVDDLDGLANGTIQTSWYVNPDDSLDATFLLSATAIGAADVPSGVSATHSFTDSGGSYSLKWAAADPTPDSGSFLATYGKLTPAAFLAAGHAYPVGRATAISNPLDNAVAYGPTYSSNNFDAVSSLAPQAMALGQIVPFLMQITVTGSTAAENGVITFTTDFLAKTSNGGNFGFDTNYKIVAAFVDTRDAGHLDPSGTASVDGYTAIVLDAGGANERIEGTFQVSGLESGDRVIVEIWAVLKDTIASGVTGNVQTSVISAHTGPANTTGETISTGAQTVPLLRSQDFFSADADLSVTLSDNPTAGAANLTASNDVDPASLKPGDTFSYTLQVKNNSTTTVANGVVLTDTLPAFVTFVSATGGGVHADNGAAADTVSWSLGALTQGQMQTVTVTVRVNVNAPTGASVDDLVNSATVSAITGDANSANNTNTEATNLVPAASAFADADESHTTAEDSAISGNVLTGTTSVNGAVSVMSFTIAGSATVHAAGASAAISGVGTLSIAAGGAYTFTPAANYNGTVPVASYTMSDGTGGDTSTLTIAVSALADGYADASESHATLEDTGLAGNVLAGTSSVDGAVTVTGFTVGGAGYAPGQSAVSSAGTLTIQASGAYSFQPAANYFGQAPTAAYTTSDGVTAVGASLAISVSPVADGYADASESVTTLEDTPVSGNLLAGTNSVDGAVAITAFSVAGITTLFSAGQIAKIPNAGVLLVAADGAYAFTPAPNYNGPVPLVTYASSDGASTVSSSLAIAITPVLDLFADAGESVSTLQGTPLSGSVLAGTSSVEGAVAVTAFAVAGSAATYTAGQSATIAGAGTLVINADGSFLYSPTAQYRGALPLVTYSTTDGLSLVQSVLSVMVTPVDNAPLAVDSTLSVDEDGNVFGSMLAHDIGSLDGGNVWSLLTQATHGTAVINADGTYNYKPFANYHGADSFSYVITDIDGSTATATVAVTVSPVDDKPLALADTLVLDEDAMGTGNLAANDTASAEGGNVWSLLSAASNGTALVKADGSYTYTPSANFNGTDSFTYQITDADGSTATASVAIVIAPVDDKPLALDDAQTVAENGSVSGTVASNDILSGDGGNLWSIRSGASNGAVALRADGTYTYTPRPGFFGADSFTYALTDANGSASYATVTMTVIGGDHAPLAVADTLAIAEDSGKSAGNLAANDTPSRDGGNVWSLATAAAHGVAQVNADGTYSYAPSTNFHGADSFTYQIKDIDGSISRATVSITVAAVADGFADADEAVDTFQSVAASGTVLSGTSSVDGPVRVATFSIAGSAQVYSAGQSATIDGVGVVSIGVDGSYAFAPLPAFSGTVPLVSYAVSDGASTDLSTLSIRVSPVIRGYTDADEVLVTAEDTLLSGSVLNGTASPDGTVSVASFSLAGGAMFAAGQKASIAGVGSLTINANGVFAFAPAPNYYGAVPLATYSTTDGVSKDVSTLAIAVTPVTDRFTDASESVSTPINTPLEGNVLAGTSSVEGPVTVTSFVVAGSSATWLAGQSATIAGAGTLAISADGSYRFIPLAAFSGKVPLVTYHVTDGASELSSTLAMSVAATGYDSAQITPTGVSAVHYMQRTAPDFSAYYAAQGGDIQYSVGSNGAVTQTNPGVFFYYTGLSNTIKGIDADRNGKADMLKVFIDQSDNSATFGAFAVNRTDVKLWKVTDVNKNGIIDLGDTLAQVQLNNSQIVLGNATGAAPGATLGDVTVNFTPDAIGALYLLSVQYSTGSVVGTKVGSARPSVHYDFRTDVVNVGPAGSYEETDLQGIDLSYKPTGALGMPSADPEFVALELVGVKRAYIEGVIDNWP